MLHFRVIGGPSDAGLLAYVAVVERPFRNIDCAAGGLRRTAAEAEIGFSADAIGEVNQLLVSVLVFMGLLVIVSINYPFTGPVHIGSEPLQHVVEDFEHG